jgi:hypothetical protein
VLQTAAGLSRETAGGTGGSRRGDGGREGHPGEPGWRRKGLGLLPQEGKTAQQGILLLLLLLHGSDFQWQVRL